jgi:plastocyanin
MRVVYVDPNFRKPEEETLKLSRLQYALAASVILLSACGSDSSGPSDTTTVTLTATTFSPSDITIARGETVRWRNGQAIQHNITPGNPLQVGAWTATTLSAQGATFEHTFNTAGTFNYSCTLHPATMTGRVVVQ